MEGEDLSNRGTDFIGISPNRKLDPNPSHTLVGPNFGPGYAWNRKQFVA
jgi:hypothetical protein